MEYLSTLTQSIINSDTFVLFFDLIAMGAITGTILGILVRATWWIWR